MVQDFCDLVDELIANIRAQGADDSLLEKILEKQFHFPLEFNILYMRDGPDINRRIEEISAKLSPKYNLIVKYLERFSYSHIITQKCPECEGNTYVHHTKEGDLSIRCQDVEGCGHDCFYSKKDMVQEELTAKNIENCH